MVISHPASPWICSLPKENQESRVKLFALFVFFFFLEDAFQPWPESCWQTGGFESSPCSGLHPPQDLLPGISRSPRGTAKKFPHFCLVPTVVPWISSSPPCTGIRAGATLGASSADHLSSEGPTQAPSGFEMDFHTHKIAFGASLIEAFP